MNKIIIILVLVGLFLLLNNKPKENFRGCFPKCVAGTKCCFSGKHRGKCIMFWSNCNK
jgi:hypothetical protein